MEISTRAFYGCSLLSEIRLTGGNVVYLTGVEAFAGTHQSLRIRVPSRLVGTYRKARFWSEVASRIVAS
jgi:hypothetical protein